MKTFFNSSVLLETARCRYLKKSEFFESRQWFNPLMPGGDKKVTHT